jgi:hypothetical protein
MQKLARIGIGVLVIGGVIGLKFYNKGSAAAEIHDEMHKWVASAHGYSEDPAYADALFEKCHEAAFVQAYTMGGRRRESRFDDDRYIDELTRTMAAMARKDGHEMLAMGLLEMKQRYDAAPE